MPRNCGCVHAYAVCVCVRMCICAIVQTERKKADTLECVHLLLRQLLIEVAAQIGRAVYIKVFQR